MRRVAQRVVVAADVGRVALQLADHRAGVDVVHADHPAPLGDDPEADAVRLLAGVGAVPGAVQVQDDAVPAGPPGHGVHRGVPDGQVDHDDDAAEAGREVGPLVHVLHGGGGDVEVVALDLAGPLLGAVDRLHREQEPVPPAHERLRVDVLVVLGEVQAAAQRLVDDPAVVARGQAELGLGRRAQQRPAVLVQVLPLHHDAVRRALVRLDVVQRDPHVLQAQRLQRLEAEHVADDRRGQVRDRALLEQVDVVGDVGDVLALAARDRVDPVALGLVVVVGGEPVGPDHRPGRGEDSPATAAPASSGGTPGCGVIAEGGQDVGVLGGVVGRVVAHLRVRDDARAPAVLLGGHGSSGWVRAVPDAGSSALVSGPSPVTMPGDCQCVY